GRRARPAVPPPPGPGSTPPPRPTPTPPSAGPPPATTPRAAPATADPPVRSRPFVPPPGDLVGLPACPAHQQIPQGLVLAQRHRPRPAQLHHGQEPGDDDEGLPRPGRQLTKIHPLAGTAEAQ